MKKLLLLICLLCNSQLVHILNGMGVIGQGSVKRFIPEIDYKLPKKNGWTLDLSKKGLTRLINLDMPDMEKIQKVDLSDNNLSLLNADLFKKFTDLEELNISNNKLTELPPTIFTHNKKLKKVTFTGNNFDEKTKKHLASFAEQPTSSTVPTENTSLTSATTTASDNKDLQQELKK